MRLKDLAYSIFALFHHNVTMAAYDHLFTLSFHTVGFVEAARVSEKDNKLDLKAWSRQCANLRMRAPLDAGRGATAF